MISSLCSMQLGTPSPICLAASCSHHTNILQKGLPASSLLPQKIHPNLLSFSAQHPDYAQFWALCYYRFSLSSAPQSSKGRWQLTLDSLRN